MGSKRLYALIIFYIALLAVIFKQVYPQVSPADVAIVLVVLGYISALITNTLINRLKK